MRASLVLLVSIVKMIIVILTRAITGACAFETRPAITDVTVIMVFWDATVTSILAYLIPVKMEVCA